MEVIAQIAYVIGYTLLGFASLLGIVAVGAIICESIEVIVLAIWLWLLYHVGQWLWALF